MSTRGEVSFDHIVVGGGTAGAVVAARLSEERGRRVLLLEAGPDYPGELPAALLDLSAAVLDGHNWDLQAILSDEEAAAAVPVSAPVSAEQARIARVFQVAAGRLGAGLRVPTFAGREGGGAGVAGRGAGAVAAAGARVMYPLGKVVGGGSAINGGLAFYPRPEDCAAWVGDGHDAWSWERVRPFVERVSRGDAHKAALTIEKTPVESLNRCQAAFLDSCLGAGHAAVDLAEGSTAGVGVLPRGVRNGHRLSMATLYLAGARGRGNLTIQSQCPVDRVVFEGRGDSLRATGVEAIVEGRRCRFSGEQIVLSAGAIGSPAILQRSGVGSAEALGRVGVACVLDRPGVGRELQDHPAISIWAVPKAGACRAGEDVHQVMLQQRSAAGAGASGVAVAGAASGGAASGGGAASRGAGADARCDLQFFMLSGILTAGFPALRDVVASELALGVSVVVATPRSRGHVAIVDRDPQAAPRITLNCVQETADLQRMMEGLRAAWGLVQDERLARHIERVVLWSPRTIESDALLARMIRSAVRTVWHPVGTLRMGREEDGRAVVDQQGRLHGCRNVSVADASILPTIPSVPPNLTCALIGERIGSSLE